MKRVLIVEKPKMLKKYKEALKGENIVYTYSIGHIEELESPEEYISSGKKIYWDKLLESFPLIPKEFKHKITNKSQFKQIESAVKGSTEIILACDPDREGELIQRNILKILREKGLVTADKITRVWLHSETIAGIKEAYDKRADYMEYEGWYQAASTRAIIDWLIGIQLTVLYSVRFGQPGKPISIGRVQTWLLSEIVKRYLQFTDFKPETYFTFSFLTDDKVSFNLINDEGKINQFFDEKEMKKVEKSLKGEKLLVKSVNRKKFTELAPSLYDLSSLQKDAASKYSITPDETLKLAQKLYEDYELISYPRTDCNVLSKEEVKELGKSMNLVYKFEKYKELVMSVKEENSKLELNKKYVGKLKGHYAIKKKNKDKRGYKR